MNKNLIFYQYPKSALPTIKMLTQHLSRRAFRPIGPLEMKCGGFVSPYGGEDEGLPLHIQIEDMIQVTLMTETRVVPADAVKRAVSEKVKLIAQEEQRTPGSAERARIRNEILEKMMPQALTKTNRINAYFDTTRRLFIVATSNLKQAEDVIGTIRAVLGTFAVMRCMPFTSPSVAMTNWLLDPEKVPEGIELGAHCELSDPATKGSLVRCQHQDLEATEIREHVRAGKHCTKVEVILKDMLSFVIQQDLTIKRIEVFGVNAPEGTEDGESHEARVEGDLLINGRHAGTIYDALKDIFLIESLD